MAKFKKVVVGSFFPDKEDFDKVEITTTTGKFKIIPTRNGKGLRISLLSNDGVDAMTVYPKAVNMVEIR